MTLSVFADCADAGAVIRGAQASARPATSRTENFSMQFLPCFCVIARSALARRSNPDEAALRIESQPGLLRRSAPRNDGLTSFLPQSLRHARKAVGLLRIAVALVLRPCRVAAHRPRREMR